VDQILRNGLVIAFDRRVRAIDLTSMTIEVQVQLREDQKGTLCWCNLVTEAVQPVMLERACDPEGGVKTSGAPLVDGLRWIAGGMPDAIRRNGAPARVLLHGDLIRDDKDRGVDGNHLPPWVPARRSGDGIEGGLFMSFFDITP
jgi:hypothetical protein